MKTSAPNEVWNCDLTAVPKLGGFWIPWLPQAIAQHWPWCFWVVAVTDHFSRRVMGTKVFDDVPSSTAVRRFLAEVMRRNKVKPAVLITDQGPQFTPEGFQAWCERRHVEPRYGAVGKHGSIAVIERFFGTLKREFLRRQVVPLRRANLQREVGSFITWFNGSRPHTGLGGCTPNENYFRRSPANLKPRIEPRARWPRASPCAMPLASIKGPCGQQVELHVRYHAGDKRLPVVTLRRVA